MIDIKFLRENPEVVKENIRKKFQDQKLHLVDEIVDLDAKNRNAKLVGDDLRMKRNSLSSEIGNLMKNGKKKKLKKLKFKYKKLITNLRRMKKLKKNIHLKLKKE